MATKDHVVTKIWGIQEAGLAGSSATEKTSKLKTEMCPLYLQIWDAGDLYLE